MAERVVLPTAMLDLIEHLPPGAAVWRAIDPESTAWDLPTMLLALLVDEVRVLRWEFERVNFKGKKPAPAPIPRPGVEQPEDRQVTQVGANEGFDTIADFDDWYRRAKAAARAPEIDERGRMLPQRDAKGRFVRR